MHQKLDDHLKMCPECRQEFEWLALTHRLLGRKEEEELSADFIERLVGRLWEERAQGKVMKRGLISRNLRLVVGAAALLLLFLWGDHIHNLPELQNRYKDSYERQGDLWTP